MEIKLKIEDKYVEAFMNFIKTLDYVEVTNIKDETMFSSVSEPTVAYGNPKKLMSDLETKDLVELEKFGNKVIENKAEGWKRVSQDEEMVILANEGINDYQQILNNYEKL
jgi:DNA-binding Lrp family transcriptional regulator